MNSIKIFCTISLISLSILAWGKDPIQSEVVVTKSYQPQLNNHIQKIPFQAIIPDSMRVQPKISFTPKHIISEPGMFNPKQMEALLLPEYAAYVDKSPTWDISAGLGSLIDPFLHVQGVGKDSMIGHWNVDFLHNSTHRSITRFNDLKSPNHQSLTQLTGSSEWKIKQHYLFNAQVDYRNTYHILYGYSAASLPKLPYQSYHLFHGSAGFENLTLTKTDWKYRLNMDLHKWSDAYDNQEIAWKLKGQIEKFRKVEDRIGINLSWSTFSQDLLNGKEVNNIIEISPYYAAKMDQFSVSGELKLVFDNRSTTHFFPYLNAKVSYDAMGDQIACPFASIEGEHQSNSLSEWTRINPYLSPTNPHPANTDYRFGARIGVEGKMGAIFSYHVSQAFKKMNDAAFFLNYPSTVGASDAFFMMRYDNVKIIETLLKANYEILPSLSAEGKFCYRSYFMKQLDQPYQIPAVDANLTLAYTILEKTKIRLTGQYYGDFFGNQPDASYTPINVPSSFNLSLQGVYQWHNNYRLWLNLNNLLNQSVARFYRYNEYGFNLQVGIGLQF